MGLDTISDAEVDWRDLKSEGSCNRTTYRFIDKSMKVLYLFLVVIIVFASAILQKGTVITVTSQMYHGQGIEYECSRFSTFANNNSSNNNNKTYYTKCIFRHKDAPKKNCTSPNAEGDVREVTWRSLPCKALTLRWVWSLFLIMITPEVFIVIRNAIRLRRHKERARCKQYESAKWDKDAKPNMAALAYVSVFVIESLQTIGMCVLAFVVLPLLDSVVHSLALLLGAGLVPGLLNLLRGPRDESDNYSPFLLDIFGCLAQASALICWPILIGLGRLPVNHHLVWAVPLALVLSSIGWIFNYLGRISPTDLNGKLSIVFKVRKYIDSRKNKIYLYLGLWRPCLMFVCMVLLTGINYNLGDIFSLDLDSCTDVPSMLFAKNFQYDWVYVWLVNIGSSFICYVCCYSATKVCCQRIGYALPLTMAAPLMMAIAMVTCSTSLGDMCAFPEALSERLVWDCPNKELWIGALSFGILWLSEIWISRHLWTPTNPKLVGTQRLFHAPLWNGLFFSEHLRYNRVLSDQADLLGGSHITAGQVTAGDQEEDPRLKVCATMWHETPKEMERLIKSFCKLDIDQSTGREQHSRPHHRTHEVYTFEAHIFFDDAIEKYDPKKQLGDGEGASAFDISGKRVNTYVIDLMIVLEGIGKFYGREGMVVDPPVKYSTPYGGRLVWTLPGGHDVIVHLKDKTLIQKKKRASQIMYLRYFLGYELGQIADECERQRRAANTFLLALDGDVVFEPNAVKELLARVMSDEDMASVCGRIIPVGPGWMVWYQKFEYTLGHWMEKATEHAIGTVLCSPGCFSMLRGSVLLDKSVLGKFIRTAVKGHQLIRCDQGEDLWLCMLLLRQGYHIQYCETAEAETVAPTTLPELFKQRRRWVSSGFLNTLFFIRSAKRTLKFNDHATALYLLYHGVMLLLNLIKSGMVFGVIASLPSKIFPEAVAWTWIAVNIVVWFSYILVCMLTKDVTQMRVATGLAAYYCVVQLIVMGSSIRLLVSEDICSPSTIFFSVVIAFFLLAALMHPLRAYELLHGLSYIFLTPTMQLLLVSYTMCTLNTISWGVRESAPAPPEGATDGHVNLGFTGANNEDDPSIKTARENEIRENSEPPADDSYVSGEFDYTCEFWIADGRYIDDEPDLQLLPSEEDFFKELISAELKPAAPQQAEKEWVENDLRKLRNTMLMVYIISNVVFVTFIFGLQAAAIKIDWPCGDDLSVDLSFIILISVFGLILFSQFIGMVLYQFGRMQRLVANTPLTCDSVCCAENNHGMVKSPAEPMAAPPNGNIGNLRLHAVDTRSLDPCRSISWQTPTIPTVAGLPQLTQQNLMEKDHKRPMDDSSIFITHF